MEIAICRKVGFPAQVHACIQKWRLVLWPADCWRFVQHERRLLNRIESMLHTIAPCCWSCFILTFLLLSVNCCLLATICSHSKKIPSKRVPNTFLNKCNHFYIFSHISQMATSNLSTFKQLHIDVHLSVGGRRVPSYEMVKSSFPHLRNFSSISLYRIVWFALIWWLNFFSFQFFYFLCFISRLSECTSKLVVVDSFTNSTLN